MASGAGDVLADAQIVPDIESALAGAAYTVAMTARQREFGPPRLLPRDAAARGYEVLAAAPDAVIAFVFGNERYGLPNDAVERCAAVTHIPANPAYASLNLAQAVQLITYEMRLALLAAPEARRTPRVISAMLGSPPRPSRSNRCSVTSRRAWRPSAFSIRPTRAS